MTNERGLGQAANRTCTMRLSKGKVRLYGDNPSVQPTLSQIASGELQGVAGGRGELR